MLPDGWKKTYLREIISAPIKNGYSPVSPAQPTGKWVLGLGALTPHGLDATKIKPAPLNDSRVDQSRLKIGDFLISRSNTPDKVGESSMFRGEVDNCSYPDLMMRFRINESVAKIEYVECVLRSEKSRAYIKRSASGTSESMVKITKPTLEKLPLYLPPLQEQSHIARILTLSDKRIEFVEHALESKRNQKRHLMQRLLTGKLRFAEFSGQKWNPLELADICIIKKGQQLNKTSLTKKGMYPAINGGIIPSGYTDQWNIEANTITISEGGNSCGFVSWINSRFWCGGHCYALINPRIDIKFLYQFLKWQQNQIMRLRVGSGLPNIQKSDLESFVLLVPESSEEQRKIAAVLSAADREIDQLTQKLEAYKQQKKGLMQQLLTGKKRVGIGKSEAA